MNIITLDFTGCKTISDIHDKIQTAFDFSEEYGRNWSAFWDFLWSECDADKVILQGEYTLPEDLHSALFKLHEILERNTAFRSENGFHAFSYEIIS